MGGSSAFRNDHASNGLPSVLRVVSPRMMFFRRSANAMLTLQAFLCTWALMVHPAEFGSEHEGTCHGQSSSGSSCDSITSVDLFLIGKTGHGKSSTGNSILGREAFQVSDDSESETNVIQVGWARRHNRIIKVVDGPGLFETRLSKGEAAKKMAKDMSAGIMQCPKGFHAMLLVLKYGNRFTEEELVTIEILKAFFGPDFVRDFCIIVFTHGTNFDINNKRTPGRTFQNWLQDQKGAMRMLLDEVDNRAVLFYDPLSDRNEAQVLKLLMMVDGLKSRGIRYTNEMFIKMAASREKLIVKENALELREKIQEKINLLMDGVERVKQQSELNDEVKSRFADLKRDARDLETEIAVEDKSTGVLDSLKQIVSNILLSVESHEEALKGKMERERFEIVMREVNQNHEESLRQLRIVIENANKRSGILSRLVAGVNYLANKLANILI